MERTEPTLIPEWLRCTGNVAGGGTSVHHSDVPRNRCSRINSEKDGPSFLERSSSSNSRHNSSSNGSTKHPYSSFSRSRCDKNRDRDREKSRSRDMRDHDSSDPFSGIINNRVEKSGLRRSQSLVSRKHGDPLPRKVQDSRISGNGVLSGGSNLSTTQKAVFEQDFPSLGTEEKQGVAGIKRILSPGLSSVVQSLPIGNAGFLCGEKWTSALVEVPPILANNGTGQSPSLIQSAVTDSNSTSGVSSRACLNMAKALSQPAAARIHANLQQPDKSQRLEELAIKQSRQLIPMLPSMPKPLVPSSTDKPKQPKTAVRTNETTVVSRGVAHPQPHSNNLAYQSRARQIKSDPVSTSHVGKFLVLKPGREIITSGAKDGFSSDANFSRVNTNGQPDTAPPTPTALTSPSVSSSMVYALEKNAAALTISSRPTVDKKPTKSLLAKSRSEFFNLMRRKASPSATTTRSDSISSILPTIAETSAEEFNEGHADASSRHLENGDVGDNNSNNNSMSGNGSIYPDEEEAAFLRSLGWDENGGEDEGLTEEEINAFYQEYMNRRPSMELNRSSQLKCSTMSMLNVIPGVSKPEA
ncbi:hypothetical protein OROGR_032611 [Orobanche gracilis]